MSIVDQGVREILAKYVTMGKLSDTDSLVDAGVIDSLNILNMVTELESKFEIEFRDNDYSIENFKTVNSIKNIVTSKVGKRA